MYEASPRRDSGGWRSTAARSRFRGLALFNFLKPFIVTATVIVEATKSVAFDTAVSHLYFRKFGRLTSVAVANEKPVETG